jgi:C-terminal processing protease CtpA/Prc
LSLAARQSDFATFVSGFEDNYAYLDRAEKPWTTWQSRYSAAVTAADTPETYAAVFEAALDELHDFHAEVRSHNPHRWLPVPTFADIWAELRGGKAVVVAVRRGSDAERAGIVPGDIVTGIGGEPLDTAIAQRLTPAVDNRAPAAREWALLSLLAGRADEIRQITVTDKQGRVRTVSLPLQRRFDRSLGPLSATLLPDGIGLIRFNNSLGDQKTVDAFDTAFKELRSTRGLILDLRDVPSGGDSSVALGIMGRFVTTMLPYQRHRIPDYGQPDVERNWLELVAPRGPFTYKRPVVVLVDHWTGSMGEGMAIGFDGMHRALVIGTPMAHLAGAVADFTLPKTGIDVAYADEQLYHVNGTPRQNWLPPVLVPDDTAGSDPIQSLGVCRLEELIASSTSSVVAVSPSRGNMRSTLC